MFLLLAFLPAAGWAQEADLVVIGARIYTVDSANPNASSLAVKHGRILAVGDDVSAFLGPNTRRIDARGATVIPGFIDCHAHMQGLGEVLESLDFRYVSAIAEIAEAVRKKAEASKPGEWIQGRKWDQTNWGGRFPTADPLTLAALQ